jgi:hypothetical protein
MVRRDQLADEPIGIVNFHDLLRAGVARQFSVNFAAQ